MSGNYLAGLEDIEPREEASGRPRRHPKLSYCEKQFNIALWKIVKGKGSRLQALAVITGDTIDSIKAKVKRVEFDYPPEDVEPDDGLDSVDCRYLSRRFGNSDDPAVREFLASIHSPIRTRPDWRPSSDRVGPVGKSKRIRLRGGD